MKNPEIGDYEHRSDGSYRLYLGKEIGWILCDDEKDLQEELTLLKRKSPCTRLK